VEKLLDAKHFTMIAICNSAYTSRIAHLVRRCDMSFVTIAVSAAILDFNSSCVFTLCLYIWVFHMTPEKVQRREDQENRGGGTQLVLLFLSVHLENRCACLGLRMKVCLKTSQSSSVLRGRPVECLFPTMPVCLNCSYHPLMLLSTGGLTPCSR
jgi:hypothetical protein